MKTSLGNVLDPNARDARKWRSSSDASDQQQPPRLFKSMREAVEFESQRPPLLHTEKYPSASGSFEQLEADEAGYTVIRRRAVSDLTQTKTQTQSGHRSVSTSEHGKTQERSRGHSNTASQSHSKHRKSKRQPSLKSSENASIVSPWNHHGLQHQSPLSVSNPSRAEEERWLAAASIGAVAQTPLQQNSEASATREGSNLAWQSAQDQCPPPRATVSRPKENDAAADSPPSSAEESLDASMISWLEKTLSLGDI